jgi:hypothetical protein
VLFPCLIVVLIERIFLPANKIYPDKNKTGLQYLSAVELIDEVKSNFIYYRLKIFSSAKDFSYSNIIKIDLSVNAAIPLITITPNPVSDAMSLNVFSSSTKKMQVILYDGLGKKMRSINTTIKQGNNSLTITAFQNWQRDIYTVKVFIENEVFVKKMLLVK